MGHATHFLQRLDRIPRAQIDFALALYRDEELLHWVLRYAHVAKDEERVALAIADGGHGPHVVVTRDGHFVTTLGEGMSTGGLRVIARAQLDAFIARVNDARRRQELAREVVPGGMRPVDVLGLLLARPNSISREEMGAIMGWAPLLDMDWRIDILKTASVLQENAQTLTSFRGKLPPVALSLAEDSWKLAHHVGALWPLATVGDIAWVEELLVPHWDVDVGPTFSATVPHVLSIALRGAWAAARMGKAILPLYKRLLLKEGLPLLVVFDAVIGTTAIGLRHARCADDARRMLEGARDAPWHAGAQWAQEVFPGALRALDDPEAALAEPLAYGRQVHGTFSRILYPEGSPQRFERDEDVPRELALLEVANSDADSYVPMTIDVLPWVARLASPEELYYPEALERRLRTAVTPDRLVAWVEAQRADWVVTVETKRAEKLPGRNDPCSCGSGKKYKKCCGR